MVRQLIRIGYDRLNGYLAGGLETWTQARLPTESTEEIGLERLKAFNEQAEGLIVDVRQRNEFHAGHIKGSLNIELGELTEHLDGLPRELPIVTICASGMRSTIAGSILRRDGRKNIQVVDDSGAPQWVAGGYPSEEGEE
jgi:hydroxyacylglutathione hydrolase